MEIAAQGPLEIELTIKCGVDKEGRTTFDWEASATVPKGVTPPRVNQYLAKQIMEGAIAAMEIKDNLNWSVHKAEVVEPAKSDNDPDALP